MAAFAVVGPTYGRDRFPEVMANDYGDGIHRGELAAAFNLLERGMRPHFVYFVEAHSTLAEYPPMVKIGTSAMPDKRVDQICKQLHTAPDWLGATYELKDIRLMGLILGDEELEQQLHRAFRAHRIAGEWFWLEPLEIAIDHILSDYCVCQPCLVSDEVAGLSWQ